MPTVNPTSLGLDDNYMDDDLFDYDVEIPDIDTTIKSSALPEDKKKDTLGIDEEVKIKKRRIVVKLDEARLMSDVGIPKLRREAPKKLKFKGKGHEYRDTARLLSYYQFWADDLYKKAKFRDTLQIIEKLGHSKSMKDQRLSWIEETKRREKLSRAGSPGDGGSGVDVIGGETESRTEEVSAENQNDDDLYSLPQPRITRTDAQSGATEEAHASSSGALFLPRGADDTSDDEDFGAGPDGDELNALMGVETAGASASASVNHIVKEKIANTDAAAENVAPPMDDFEDEMEAMAGFGPPEW